MNTSTVTAVIFDVDGVLLDSFESNLQFFQELMKATGYRQPTRDEYKGMYHKTMLEVIQILTKENDPEKLQRIWAIGHDLEYADEIPSRMPDHCIEVLRSLCQEYSLGIVTNRIRKYVFEGKELQSIAHVFKVVLAFEDTERHKPDPEPLMIAMRMLGSTSYQTVYIGDTQTDIDAGRAAGVPVILYSDTVLPGAAYTTHRFADLPDLVKRFS